MANFIADLTAELACEALRGAGVTCSPKDIAVVAREERWAVSLPGETHRLVRGVRGRESTPRP